VPEAFESEMTRNAMIASARALAIEGLRGPIDILYRLHDNLVHDTREWPQHAAFSKFVTNAHAGASVTTTRLELYSNDYNHVRYSFSDF
jgi:hypothetical protein